MSELHSGERQVAPSIEGIRRDHVARYQWAARYLNAFHLQERTAIDVGCGVGYGTEILAREGRLAVLGIDRSGDAIDYARHYYSRRQVQFEQCAIENLGGLADLSPCSEAGPDVAVAFEILEHLADPAGALRAIAALGARTLLASVPNEDVFPFRSDANQGRGYKFHARHYRRAELEELLASAGWRAESWFGQKGTESDVEPDVNGRTLVVVARYGGPRYGDQVDGEDDLKRAPIAAVGGDAEPDPPEHVVLLGLGPSLGQYVELVKRLGSRRAYANEVWGINAVGDVILCDRLFHMDDVRIQERRAERAPESNIANMLAWLRERPGPIYTSRARDGYPGLVDYPLEAVLNGNGDGNGGAPYFNSTAAYAVAFAIHIGVKRLSLFGLDFAIANVASAERGRGCVEFWLGVAAARGIEIQIPETSTLMDASAPERERFYGFDCADVRLADRPDGSVAVSIVDRDENEIPSAEEIERRYDHSRHPNQVVREEIERQ